MADNNLTTGKSQLNSQLVAGAANLAGPAAQLASGASSMQVASGILKDAFMDKLLGPAAAFTGVLAGSLIVMRKLVRESQILEKGLVKISNLQQIEGKFETLLKSAALAKQRIKELYDFVKNSPFKFSDVAEGNRQLEALTYGAFSGAKAMKLVGDTAAATGEQFADTAGKVGKLYSALASGRSIDKIAFQLQFTGIATEGLLDRLEKLEAAGAGFTEMWGEVEKVLARNQGGMENEMQTLEALSAKLEEARGNMQKAFAMPFVEAQSKSIRTMTEATKNLTPVLAAIGEDMAAVKGAFVDLESGLLDVTLAAPRMATALEGAWVAVKTLLGSLAVVTVANFVKGFAPMMKFAGAVKTVATESIAVARASEVGAVATAAWTAAKQAAVEGDLKLAASQALVTARFWVTTAAMAVHRAGLAAVWGAPGVAPARHYVLGASLTVVGGAAKLAGTALRSLASGAVGAVTALGFVGAAIASLVAGFVAFFAIRSGAKAVTKEFDQLANAVAATDKKLNDLLSTAKNTDEWAKAVSAVTDEIAKAELALDDLNAKAAERGTWDKVKGFFTGENIRLEGAQADAARRPEMLRAQRRASMDKLPFLGRGSKESEAFARDLQTAQATSDAALENRLQLADDAARVALLEKEADRLHDIATAAKAARDVMEQFNRSTAKLSADSRLSDAADSKSRADKTLTDLGVDVSAPRAVQRAASVEAMHSFGGSGNDKTALYQKQKAAIDASIAADAELLAAEKAVAELRRASSSQLVKNNQEIEDLTAKGKEQTEEEKLRLVELQKQNIVLLDQVKNADALATAEQQRKNQLQAARDAQAVNAAGSAVDPAILVATAQGNEALVAELQMKKELAKLEEQITQATRDGNEELAESLTLQAAMIISAKAAADAKFAREAQAAREENAALIAGDKKGAQAIRDAEDLRKLTEDYAKNGLTAEQAKADFAQGIVAGAAGQAPSIATDSKQAIGGGGRAFQAADPILRAQERVVRLNEQIAKSLENIDTKMDES